MSGVAGAVLGAGVRADFLRGGQQQDKEAGTSREGQPRGAPVTQAREGPGASILMVGATIRSSVAGIAFFGIVGAILVEHGIFVTYTLATASTVMLGLALAAPEARHRGNRMVQHSAVQRAAA